jgi:hypothetical protein
MGKMSKPNVRRPRVRRGAADLIDRLLQHTNPSFDAFFIEEPNLLFAGHGLAVDPKAGLETHGPFDLDHTGRSKIRIGIIGTGNGIQTVLSYLSRCESPIHAGLNARGKPYDPLCFPSFPGCSEHTSFRCRFVSDQSIQRPIPQESFEGAVKGGTGSEKLRRVVELVTKELQALAELESPPDVAVFVMPQIVEHECGTIGMEFQGKKIQLTVSEKVERKLAKESLRTGQALLGLEFDVADERTTVTQRGFWNLHHAIKAHSMASGLSTQLVWEGTLSGGTGTQDPASIAWNLLTALYYKAGNRPWQLQMLPENACYVGVSFYKETPHADADMQTSLAQVFGAGEGLVLKGRRAIVDRRRDRKAHLDEDAAYQLLAQAIELYSNQTKAAPRRVVVHKTSKYWPEELRGFKKALGNINLYDFLTLETLGTRFMRVGKKPPLRGTVIVLSARNYLMYTLGYIPYFRDYPGMRIPQPIEVVEHHGTSPAQDVCREILALTKLNWNSCAFASSVPITIRFARDVGRILTELPKGIEPKTKYKYYM